MFVTRRPLFALLAAVLLAGCTATTTGGGGTTTISNDPDGQLRNSVRRDTFQMGISDECIDSLDRSQLGRIKAFTAGSTPRLGTLEWMTYRQQVRTFVGKYCPDL